MVWDQSHMCHNDIWDEFKESGEYHRVVFVLLRLNIPVTPWQEDLRWRQVEDCVDEMFLHFDNPRQIQFFEEMEHDLLHGHAGLRSCQNISRTSISGTTLRRTIASRNVGPIQ
ncbi:hypothetical protein N9L19_00915 [bacterium]|nr:hypothetical protein [bacterium]